MRLIDADALHLGKFVEPRTEWHKGWNDALYAAADAAPTIDAVTVVRCKDCKHYQKTQACRYHSENELPFDFDVFMCPNDFCSYGERKTDGEVTKVL